jgi:hypothetical protein
MPTTAATPNKVPNAIANTFGDEGGAEVVGALLVEVVEVVDVVEVVVVVGSHFCCTIIDPYVASATTICPLKHDVLENSPTMLLGLISLQLDDRYSHSSSVPGVSQLFSHT